MKKIIITLIIIIGVGGIIYLNINKKKEKAIEVQTTTVKLRKIEEIVSASGRIQPVIQLNLSANVAGEIKKLFVKEGDTVVRNQLLFQLDKVRYEADVRSFRSIYNSRKASLDKVKRDKDRVEGLYKNNNISLAEMEDIQTQFRLAISSLDQAEANLNQMLDNLAKTTVRTPVAGTVIQIRKEEGEIALGSQFSQDVIMIIANLSRMEVEVEVNENDVIRVTERDEVKIEVDAIPDTSFKGIVSEIAHLANSQALGTQNAVTNFTVMVNMLEIPEELRPGMSATVEIKTDSRENAIAVPIQCVTIRPENELEGKKEDSEELKLDDNEFKKPEMAEVVFIVQEDTVIATPVILGISSDDYFEILSGVKEGDILVEGPHKVLSRELETGKSVIEEKEDSKKNDKP